MCTYIYVALGSSTDRHCMKTNRDNKRNITQKITPKHICVYFNCFVLGICSLALDKGSCKNYSENWFFDIEEGTCSKFLYSGCEGNGNRFNTENECRRLCVEPPGKSALHFLLSPAYHQDLLYMGRSFYAAYYFSLFVVNTL